MSALIVFAVGNSRYLQRGFVVAMYSKKHSDSTCLKGRKEPIMYLEVASRTSCGILICNVKYAINVKQ